MPGGGLPSCVAGKGACPPEDCGGAWGYAELKEILADPAHEDHQDRLEWLGLDAGKDFDPKKFSVAEVNARLARSRKPGESRDLKAAVLSAGVGTRPHGPTRDGASVDMLYDPAHDGIEEDPAAGHGLAPMRFN